MYIRKTVKKWKNKTYENYLLVESVTTPKGPRQKTICSLGNLQPGPVEKWLELSVKIRDSLIGQFTLELEKEEDKELEEKAREIIKKIEEYKEKKGKIKEGKSDDLFEGKIEDTVLKFKDILLPDVKKALKKDKSKSDKVIEVIPDKIEIEECREGGPVHAGLEYWNKLDLDKILSQSGLSEKSIELTKIMPMNRLIYPLSENAMVKWIKNKSALGDILGEDYSNLSNHSLYRNMDNLHEKREEIEKRLSEKERTLFNLDMTIYLYDLTSVYFEGNCPKNPQAKHGYSKDGRPDCKQVVVGIVFNRDGFPLAHEVFDGNTIDNTTVSEMLDLLEKRCGKIPGNTVVVDRGMATESNIKEITERGYHYIVASRQSERSGLLDEFEEESGWDEIIREVSPQNTYQKKSRVEVKEVKEKLYAVPEDIRERLSEEFEVNKLDTLSGRELSFKKITGELKKLKFDEEEIETILSHCPEREELNVLCISEGRKEKDRAIREGKEKKFLEDLRKLKSRIFKGHVIDEDKVHQTIGRLKERYQRVGRYYNITYNREFEISEQSLEKLKKEIAPHKLISLVPLSGNRFSREVLILKLKESGFTKKEIRLLAKYSERRKLDWIELKEKKEKAKELDGAYILKTDRIDLNKEEIWKTYSLLTRAEDAFRAMKSPLAERPIFHHLKNRVQTHIFLCILAYHLLVSIETTLRNNGLDTSWPTVRDTLATHQVCTVVLPTPGGYVLKIRKGSAPEPQHREIYDKLGISSIIMKPIKTWHHITEKNSDGNFT